MSESGSSPRIVLVAAVARNGVIGNGPDIPWKLPGEQAEFKALTMGHTLIMGRTTFDSIGRPLPGRTTVVVTRNPDWSYDGIGADRVHVAHSLTDAIATAQGLPGDVMVAGGAQIYSAAMEVATDQVLTRVNVTPEGDVFYPPFDESTWELIDARMEEHWTVEQWRRRTASMR